MYSTRLSTGQLNKFGARQPPPLPYHNLYKREANIHSTTNSLEQYGYDSLPKTQNEQQRAYRERADNPITFNQPDHSNEFSNYNTAVGPESVHYQQNHIHQNNNAYNRNIPNIGVNFLNDQIPQLPLPPPRLQQQPSPSELGVGGDRYFQHPLPPPPLFAWPGNPAIERQPSPQPFPLNNVNTYQMGSPPSPSNQPITFPYNLDQQPEGVLFPIEQSNNSSDSSPTPGRPPLTIMPSITDINSPEMDISPIVHQYPSSTITTAPQLPPDERLSSEYLQTSDPQQGTENGDQEPIVHKIILNIRNLRDRMNARGLGTAISGGEGPERRIFFPPISRVMLSLIAPRMLRFQFDMMLQAIIAEIGRKVVVPLIGVVAGGRGGPASSVPDTQGNEIDQEEEEDSEPVPPQPVIQPAIQVMQTPSGTLTGQQQVLQTSPSSSVICFNFTTV